MALLNVTTLQADPFPMDEDFSERRCQYCGSLTTESVELSLYQLRESVECELCQLCPIFHAAVASVVPKEGCGVTVQIFRDYAQEETVMLTIHGGPKQGYEMTLVGLYTLEKCKLSQSKHITSY